MEKFGEIKGSDVEEPGKRVEDKRRQDIEREDNRNGEKLVLKNMHWNFIANLFPSRVTLKSMYRVKQP